MTRVKHGLAFLCVSSLLLLLGCASVEENMRNTFSNRHDDFGPFPAEYKQLIERDFSKLAVLHHPERIAFQIRRPVKFYKVSHSGDQVEWFAWVAEVAIPDNAVYKFASSSSTDWTVYYVRFNGDAISHVYHGEQYAYLKANQGFELVETGAKGLYRALLRGAEVNSSLTTLVQFRNDLPPLSEAKPANQAQASKTNSPNASDIAEQLRTLHTLYKDGILTEAEFKAKKKQLLKL